MRSYAGAVWRGTRSSIYICRPTAFDHSQTADLEEASAARESSPPAPVLALSRTVHAASGGKYAACRGRHC
ncbi:hypothetical protein HETIRDRAFT_409582 [Heterobasidion irregulare TC 32-1]|uniref:Uncharacterized protein n=1 Tax=Heterobasidion irregulare (strain TC 32-1) TaxID=747525 RepID=W4K7P1_HETIT|nr:uncharacterized protein HETIRDRAFT_409582 [Heterobasidion irregulare TC 32-1]ETW81798.1 hypothetical protein HETIRDRAFT_409582 [Heterobasidion irregulare TC 32-1]